jgi:DNA-binding beta-propeller fold protein YncE
MFSLPGWAQDISDPRRLLFVADTVDSIIDVIDVRENSVVFRIETQNRIDDLVATPNAPILIYTSIDQKRVTFFDLKTKRESLSVDLAVTPRHMVLSPRGDRLAITDSEAGGFVLLSTYTGAVVFAFPDFPPTSDVLFDPNEVDIYFSNPRDGSLGRIDTNEQHVLEVQIAAPGSRLSAPSRSLDARYVYVANETTGEIHALNAFSRVVFKTFHIGDAPVRPYTTPEGSFLYMIDKSTGRFIAVEQFNFEQYSEVPLHKGVDLVAVGRFDRLNIFASTQNREFQVYDNVRMATIQSGTFEHTPIDLQGSADGRRGYVAFSDAPKIAVMDLERQRVEYIDAVINGVGAMSLGLTNNVCH